MLSSRAISGSSGSCPAGLGDSTSPGYAAYSQGLLTDLSARLGINATQISLKAVTLPGTASRRLLSSDVCPRGRAFFHIEKVAAVAVHSTWSTVLFLSDAVWASSRKYHGPVLPRRYPSLMAWLRRQQSTTRAGYWMPRISHSWQFWVQQGAKIWAMRL